MTATDKALATKIQLRVVAPCILFMLMSSLDRVNVSFAALKMNQELGLTPSQYGFGAGILFLGFLAGQYPSVLFMQRVGMRLWISTCAVAWGVCAASLAFIHEAWQFYALRVALGFAEGGLAPGIVLYLSQWATERQRASTFALPMLAIPLSIVIGGPISGWLMGMTAPGGMAGWRWMFLGEAAPTILLGVAAYFYFPNTPAEARWLSPEQRDWLERHAAESAKTKRRNDWSVLRHPLVWASALLWFCLLSGAYGIMFWLPQMIDSLTGLSPVQIGLVNALPWAGLAIGIYVNAAHSDRTGERFWHVGLPAAATSVAILVAWSLGPGAPGLAALFVAGVALGAAQGAFWALPTTLLNGPALAVAVVAINIAGSSGGLVMPHLVGLAREATGSFTGPTLLIAGVLAVAAALVALIRAMFFSSRTAAAQ